MMKTNLAKFVRHVHDTQDTEISCSVCLDLVSQYVDLEISTGDATIQLPLVKQHLDQCLVCSEEYQVLHQLAVLEAEQRLPTDEELMNQLKK